MKNTIEKLIEKLDAVKAGLSEVGDIRPGSVTKQKRKKHGKVYAEYWYLSYTHRGKGATEYIPKVHITRINQELRAYKKFKRLVDDYIDLSIRLSQERTKLRPE